jgi:hypothetical protein
VQDLGDLVDLLLEDAQGVGVGEHERGHVVVHLRGERGDVDHARGVRLQVLHRIAAHGDGGRVGAVRGIGDQNLLARVALGLQVSAHQQDAGELAMRPRRRLQRDRVHAADLQ